MQAKRVFLLAGLVGCGLAALSMLPAINFNAVRDPGSANLLDLMDVPHPSEQFRLFPSVLQEAVSVSSQESISTEIDFRDVNSSTLPSIQQTSADGETDIYLRPDHTRETSLTWYLNTPGSNPTLKSATSYSSDGKTPVLQLAFRTDRTRLRVSSLLTGGSYETVSYYKDGVAPASAVVIGQGPAEWDGATELLSDTEWREDGSVSHSNVLNPDNSRTIQDFGAHKELLELSHITAYVDGSTVVGYFPGSNRIRLQSKSTYFDTLASMFRTDGTLSVTFDLNAVFLEVTYYDKSGRTALLQQLWYFTKALDQNGVAKIANLQLYSVTEMDSKGSPSKEWTFRDAVIWSYESFNTNKASGAPATCAELTGFFSATDGSLQGAFCRPLSSDPGEFAVSAAFLPDRHAPPIPANDLVVPSIDQNLPIPYSDERRG